MRTKQLKNCSDDTKEKSRYDFTKTGGKSECRSFIKNDREHASICKPICCLPVLFKLFAKILNVRLAPNLHPNTTPAKQGFGPTIDPTITKFKVLEQRCREWGIPLLIDFTKTFEKIKSIVAQAILVQTIYAQTLCCLGARRIVLHGSCP